MLSVDLQSDIAEVNDYRIPLLADALASGDDSRESPAGWGALRIPADTNLADNASFFVFEKPAIRRSIIVSDNPTLIEAIELCTNIAPEQSIRCATETVTSTQLDSVDWSAISLVIWHEQLPTDRSLELLANFVSSGGQVLFLPPESPNTTQAFGFRWTSWETVPPTVPSTQSQSPDGPTNEDSQAALLARVQQWRNDSTILSNTLNGAALPVGQIGIKRICRVEGNGTALASINDTLPFLLKMDSTESSTSISDSNNGVYVCTTTPAQSDSTLAKDGVVMYVAIQRVLAAGAERVGVSKMRTVGESDRKELEQATQEVGDPTVFSNNYVQHTGVYRTPDLLIAQNRTVEEDNNTFVQESSIAELFGSLPWSRIESGANANSLVQEIWKWFVIAMLLALLIEAALCIPKRRTVSRPLGLTQPTLR